MNDHISSRLNASRHDSREHAATCGSDQRLSRQPNAALQTCQNLSEDQLAKMIPGAYGMIGDTLEHIIRAEAYYVRLLTGSSPQPLFNWEARPGLAEMAAYAAQVGKALEE